MFAAVILVWFGLLPDWAPFAFQSMGWNRGLNWFIFTDQLVGDWTSMPSNVFLKSLNASVFSRLAYRATGVDAAISGPGGGYKLCDWRMTYGEVFAAWLRPFKFWGWVDFDMILGSLADFGLNTSAAELFDVFGEYNWPVQGPLTLLRNTRRVNTLWRSIPNVFEKLGKPTIQRMNEWDFARELQASPEIRQKLFSFPIHVSANARHGLADLVWTDGRLLHLPSCSEAAYLHFSSWKANVARSVGAVARKTSRAFAIGSSGLQQLTLPSQQRLDTCLERLARNGLRYVWDWDHGLTPGKAYRRVERQDNNMLAKKIN